MSLSSACSSMCHFKLLPCELFCTCSPDLYIYKWTIDTLFKWASHDYANLWKQQLLAIGHCKGSSGILLTREVTCTMSGDTVVRVEQGYLRGSQDVTRHGCRYYSFRGVPYAKPPIGPLRFKVNQICKKIHLQLFFKMLIRKEECDTYLTHVCRHQHSVENPLKR